MKKLKNWIIINKKLFVCILIIIILIIVYYLYNKNLLVISNKKQFIVNEETFLIKKNELDAIIKIIMMNKKLFDEKTWNEVYNILKNVDKEGNILISMKEFNRLYEILTVQLKIVGLRKKI